MPPLSEFVCAPGGHRSRMGLYKPPLNWLMLSRILDEPRPRLSPRMFGKYGIKNLLPLITSPSWAKVVGWDYDAWAWYDVGHDADRRERRDRRDRGNLYLYI